LVSCSEEVCIGYHPPSPSPRLLPFTPLTPFFPLSSADVIKSISKIASMCVKAIPLDSRRCDIAMRSDRNRTSPNPTTPASRPRSQWFSSHPICHASPDDCDRSPLYDYRSPTKSGAIHTAYRPFYHPRSLSLMLFFYPMAIRSVCPRFDGSRLFDHVSAPIPLNTSCQALSTIHPCNPTADLPSSFIHTIHDHSHFMLPKDEGNLFACTWCISSPTTTFKKQDGREEKGHASSRSEHLSVMEFLQEGKQSTRECQIHSLKQADFSRDYIRELKRLVVHYDPSTHRITKYLCNQTLYIPINQM